METEQVRINKAFELAREQLISLLADDSEQRIGNSLLEWTFYKKNSRPFRLLTDPNAELIKDSVRTAAKHGLGEEFGQGYQAEVDPMILQRISA